MNTAGKAAVLFRGLFRDGICAKAKFAKSSALKNAQLYNLLGSSFLPSFHKRLTCAEINSQCQHFEVAAMH